MDTLLVYFRKKKYQQEIFSSSIVVSYHYLFIYLLAFSLVFTAHNSLPPNPFHSAFTHVVLDNILNAPSLKSSSPSTDIYVEPVQHYFHCYHIYIYISHIYITSVTIKLPSLDSTMNADFATLHNASFHQNF